MNVPRVMLAAPASGSGKTTVTCAVLQALRGRGLRLHAFKCGPDYIDPMFHERVIGAKGSNLDAFFYEDATIRWLLARHGEAADLAVLEGVMGYFDGSGFESSLHSSHQIAKATQTPVVLVVPARGMAYSLVALLRGFVEEAAGSIRGVILNQVSEGAYAKLKPAIERAFGPAVQVLGYLPNLKDAGFDSRHLGLVTPGEIADIREKLETLAAHARACIDLDGLLRLAASAPGISAAPAFRPPQLPGVRIAVARDEAFCFYYQDNLDLLADMGAQWIPFSPVRDQALPQCDALYLGGGYPELYAEALSRNRWMQESVRRALDGGMPCIAECGGFMYLTRSIDGLPMVGLLPGRCENAGRLVRFGYVTLTAGQDNLLCPRGGTIRAHEFHHYDCTDSGKGFRAGKPDGRAWACAHAGPSLYAGFPHLPLYANPAFAESFYRRILQFKDKKGQ